MTRKCFATGVCCLAACLAACGANLLPDGGFEKWNAEKDQPVGASWRWGFSQRGTNGFTVCELTAAERHGGNTSLHLKDSLSGNLNHSMWYTFSDPEAKAMSGKIMRDMVFPVVMYGCES